MSATCARMVAYFSSAISGNSVISLSMRVRILPGLQKNCDYCSDFINAQVHEITKVTVESYQLGFNLQFNHCMLLFLPGTAGNPTTLSV